MGVVFRARETKLSREVGVTPSRRPADLASQSQLASSCVKFS